MSDKKIKNPLFQPSNFLLFLSYNYLDFWIEITQNTHLVKTSFSVSAFTVDDFTHNAIIMAPAPPILKPLKGRFTI